MYIYYPCQIVCNANISTDTSNNNHHDQMEWAAICSEIKWNYLLKSSKTVLLAIMHWLLVLADAAKTNSRLLNHLFTERKNNAKAFVACLNIKLMRCKEWPTDINPFYSCVTCIHYSSLNQMRESSLVWSLLHLFHSYRLHYSKPNVLLERESDLTINYNLCTHLKPLWCGKVKMRRGAVSEQGFGWLCIPSTL